MKKLLLLLLFVPFLSCSEDKNTKVSNNYKTEKKIKSDEQNGLKKSYYPNGKLEAEQNFKNGKLDGLTKVY